LVFFFEYNIINFILSFHLFSSIFVYITEEFYNQSANSLILLLLLNYKKILRKYFKKQQELYKNNKNLFSLSIMLNIRLFFINYYKIINDFIIIIDKLLCKIGDNLIINSNNEKRKKKITYQVGFLIKYLNNIINIFINNKFANKQDSYLSDLINYKYFSYSNNIEIYVDFFNTLKHLNIIKKNVKKNIYIFLIEELINIHITKNTNKVIVNNKYSFNKFFAINVGLNINRIKKNYYDNIKDLKSVYCDNNISKNLFVNMSSQFLISDSKNFLNTYFFLEKEIILLDLCFLNCIYFYVNKKRYTSLLVFIKLLYFYRTLLLLKIINLLQY
jgi:hypothetical protein